MDFQKNLGSVGLLKLTLDISMLPEKASFKVFWNVSDIDTLASQYSALSVVFCLTNSSRLVFEESTAVSHGALYAVGAHWIKWVDEKNFCCWNWTALGL